MKKKIGLITYPRIEDGKGRFLQAYALYTAINELGYDVEIINYYPYAWRNKRRLIDKIGTFLKKPDIGEYYFILKKKYLRKRKKNIVAQSKNNYLLYINKNINYNINEIKDHLFLMENIDKFDAFVCGSDQIWNPHFSCGVDPNYYLSFAPKNKRIAYAASIGTHNISKDKLDKCVDKILEISYRSVRERSTKIMLSTKYNMKIEQVCDPTILMEKKWWDMLAGERNIKEKYLLMFLFDNNPLPRIFAEKIANLKGLKLICVSEEILDEKKYDMYYDMGPEYFVSLFKYADYVITQSFHGTVLSLLFNKQFLVFDRSEKYELDGLILRISDLLETVGLNDRIVENLTDFYLPNNINFKECNETLYNERIRSLKYLNKVLNAAIYDK